jgi:hypothetical protein
MSRATYCRDQARLCRDLAMQLSNADDMLRLKQIADRYEAEAIALDACRSEPAASAGDPGEMEYPAPKRSIERR